MAISIKYYLAYPKKEKSYIILSVVSNGDRIKTSIGLSTEKEVWDIKKGRFKSQAIASDTGNKTLDEIKNEITTLYYNNNGEISKNQILDILKFRNKKQPTFIEYFNTFVNDCKEGIRITENERISRGTWKNYETLHKHLVNFQNRTGFIVTFNSITDDFPSRFIRFLTNPSLGETKKDDNYIAKLLRYVKTFMIYAYKMKWHNFPTEQYNENLHKRTRKTHKVYLTKNEIRALYNLQIDEPDLSSVRDMFLLEIFTGLRVSDLKNLNESNFDFDEMLIKIEIEKTDEPHIVAINPDVLNILQKYNFKLPKVKTNYNRLIKVICQQSGIIKPVDCPKYYNGVKTPVIKPKYQFVSSHTARRTFATLLQQAGISDKLFMAAGGWSDEKTAKNYDHSTQLEMVEFMRKHSFINN